MLKKRINYATLYWMLKYCCAEPASETDATLLLTQHQTCQEPYKGPQSARGLAQLCQTADSGNIPSLLVRERRRTRHKQTF